MKKELQDYLEKVTGKMVFVDSKHTKHMGVNDPQKHISRLEINFSCYEDDEEKTITTVVLNIIDTPANRRTGTDYDILGVMDDETAEMGTVATDILSNSEFRRKMLIAPYLFYLEDIIVSDEFIGKGIGSKILKNLPWIVDEACNLSCYFIFFVPIAYVKEDDSEEERRKKQAAVEGFFAKNGGKPIGKKTETWCISK